MGSGEVATSLSFTIVVCESCGAERAAAARCPKCGSTTLYRDPDAEARRDEVARLRLLLDRPQGSIPATLQSLFSELEGWTPRLLPAIAMAGASGGRTEPLEDVLIGFRRLIDGSAAAHRSPQEATLWKTAEAVLAAIRGAIDAYLDALTTLVPDEAARFGEQGQRQLDAAEAILNTIPAQVRDQKSRSSASGFLAGLFGGYLWGRSGD